MTSKRYPTDLTDEEWRLIAVMFVSRERRGANRSYALRRIIDGCLYVLRGGISWRMMPHDVPPWRVVYDQLSTWRRTGKWERINQVLREQYRTKQGRKPLPTAAVIDSQSVKTTGSGAPRGFDGGKKIKGRKRQTLVDTEKNILKVKVHPADLHDKVGGMLLLHCLHVLFPTIVLVWADTHHQRLRSWAKETLGWTIEVVKHWWVNCARSHLQGGRRNARDPQRFPPPPAAMGGRKNFCVAGHQQEAVQRLREITGNRRGVHLHGDEPHSDETPRQDAAESACIQVEF
jgi:putative transposase